MHRVLSYQTAMRASSSRDIREYVTKRTCVSLILSIAFFTLIAGFLLGKFVSDRQHHMKHLRELNKSDDYLEIKDAKDDLIKQAKNFTLTLQQKGSVNNTSEIGIKTLIYEKYMSCRIQNQIPKTENTQIDIFVEDLMVSQISKQLECLNTLKDYIQNL